MQNEKERLKYGIFAGVFGIFSNSILFIAKILIGLMCASITIIADAINNFSDIGSSVILLLGFKLSNKPADTKHPFGHARIEQVMALIISVIVLMIGLLLAKSSIEKLILNEKTIVNIYAYIILGIAVIIKFIQMLIYKNISKKIDSMSLNASSIDSRNDCFATILTIIAMIFVNIFSNLPISLDGLFGVFVSIFVIVNSVILVKQTISPLIGERVDEKIEKEITEYILSSPNVIGLHDLVIHSYGVNHFMGSVHVEIDGKMNLIKAHNVIDKIERDIKSKFNINISIHIDPVQVGNSFVDKCKKKITELLKELDDSISLHDFRIVFEKYTNLVMFDILIPYDKNINIDEIYIILNNYYKKYKKHYKFMINLDRY